MQALPDCPTSTKDQIQQLISACHSILGRQLIGVYLHGSLAMGCFNSRKSDLDLLIVSLDPLSASQKLSFGQQLLSVSNAVDPIELSILSLAQARSDQYPLQFELHYGESWRARFEDSLQSQSVVSLAQGQADHDLSAHINVVLERGITLVGAPADQVFPPVNKAHLIDSLARDFQFALERIEENPVYFILNSCRLHALLVEGRLCSKLEGGDWALRRYPLKHCALVGQAKRCYINESAVNMIEIPVGPALFEFAAFVESELAPLLPPLLPPNAVPG